jgi:hypothetical protein
VVDLHKKNRNKITSFKTENKKTNQNKPEKIPKFVTQKFSDQQMHDFIENYYERRKFENVSDKSSLFSTTMRSMGRNTCLSMDRESRDNRFLENYENNRKRWQKYATILSKKTGK